MDNDMTNYNSLLKARDEFSNRFAEQQQIVNGRRWGIIRAGEQGPALLMLPGTLGRASIFWQQIELLAKKAKIVSVSYPANYNIIAWAEDLVRILDKFGIERTNIMGSSLGGYLAQIFAARFPDRIDRLIAANTLSSNKVFVTKQPYASDLANLPFKTIRQGFFKGLKEREQVRPFERNLYPLLYGEVAGGIPARNLRARLLALKHAPPIPEISLSPDRIAVIESADDPLIDPQIQQGVRSFLSPATVYRFNNGGHFPYVIQPTAYLSILQEQLGLQITGTNWGSGKERVL